MSFKNLFIASLTLTQLIKHFSMATNTTFIMGFENTSPDNTWILKSTGDDPDYTLTHYQQELAPGAQEWVESSKSFIYQVCDTSGPAAVLYVNGPGLKCAVYSGAMMNITITPDGITAKAVENTAINTLSISGDFSPYKINATTTPPPTCDLPYPMQYSDDKWRIINLEGATLFDPQFPNICDLYYFAETGVNTVRLPFKWDYLQNFLGQDIPINWATGGYGAQMLKLTNAWTEKNYTVILSMYDRMRYSYCAIGASDCWVSQARYANAWSQIAAQFLNNSRVVFGLMNNPDVYDIIEGNNNGTAVVLNNQNAAAKAIRALGAKQWTLYSGNGGSNIANWAESYYGESNAKTFVPENITDTHYQLDVEMFYEEAETLPENGCIASAKYYPQSCINKQNPENFIQAMNETGIYFVVSKTGGTNSSECIICINQGTTWLMLQENITGVGMWVGGHAWLSFNGSTNYTLYLAPEHNIPQKQMTLGFQNVSNPKTGEQFLIGLSEKSPSISPTKFPTSESPTREPATTNYLSMMWISVYAAGGVALLAGLCLVFRNNIKQNCSSLGKNWCGLFSYQASLMNTSLLPRQPEHVTNRMQTMV